MRLALAAARLCAAVRSPEDLADAYRFQAAADMFVRDEYVALADLYEPFANRVAVIEEFAAGQANVEALAVSADLDERSFWFRAEAERLEVESGQLFSRADAVAPRYRWLGRLRVRAMRAECLAVLLPSE